MNNQSTVHLPKETKMDAYVSIDIETTGLDPSTCQILEIGAVVDAGEGAVNELPTFHCYVDNDPIIGEPHALVMNRDILSHIAERRNRCFSDDVLLRPWEVASQFRRFLGINGFERDHRFTAAGKNFASFDWLFLSKLKGWHDIKIKHRVLDPGVMYWQPRIDGYKVPNLKTCLDRAGIGGGVAHTAVEDAQAVIYLIRNAVINNNGFREAIKVDTEMKELAEKMFRDKSRRDRSFDMVRLAEEYLELLKKVGQ